MSDTRGERAIGLLREIVDEVCPFRLSADYYCSFCGFYLAPHYRTNIPDCKQEDCPRVRALALLTEAAGQTAPPLDTSAEAAEPLPPGLRLTTTYCGHDGIRELDGDGSVIHREGQ